MNDFGIDQILSDLKQSSKTIERILTNERLHRRNLGDGGVNSIMSDSLMVPSYHQKQENTRIIRNFDMSADDEQNGEVTESIVSEDLEEDRVNFK